MIITQSIRDDLTNELDINIPTEEQLYFEDFSDNGHVHNWRNYVPNSLKWIWKDLPGLDHVVIFALCKKQADREEWD